MALAKAKEIVSSAPVVVFSKTYCGYCNQVKQLLTQLGASHKVIELDIECDGSELQTALAEWTGQTTLPIVFIGGNHIGVCHSNKNFVTRVVQALENGSVSRVVQNLDDSKKLELSSSADMKSAQLKSSSPTDGNPSTSSEPVTDSEDQEVSDDDDRNHKHRRREARPHSLANDVHEQHTRRPNRKRKTFERRHIFLDNDNTNLGRDVSSKFQKQCLVTTSMIRAPSDLGSQGRVSQAFRPDPGFRFDVATSIGRPATGRGRGKSTGFWSQQDSRLSLHDPLDFASHIAPQVPPAHPSLFAGTNLPSATCAQNASWGAYGFIPGINNSLLDPIHPLGMQGALQPTISTLLNIGVPRQRCRDFEERGFCLRGDMCPMEHGVNRIVVEDVQSLSQFNLPVSIPSSHATGIQVGTGSFPSSGAPLGFLTSNKPLPLKDSKFAVADKCGVTDDMLNSNGVSPSSGATEADVYDPDQPLWNNECPETSSAHLRLPSPKNDDEHLWTADSSAKRGFRLSDDIEVDHQSRIFSDNVASQSTSSSVWGRIRHVHQSELPKNSEDDTAVTCFLNNEIKEDEEEAPVNTGVAIQERSHAAKDMGPKSSSTDPFLRPKSNLGHNGGRTMQKASRTLYIHGIPQKSNRKEALLSHFQKFGNVIDIYIPLNSEIAFVQFSKREEAEAALKAPDAVMGNRFIKLWWANRDRVYVDGEGSSHTKFSQPTSMSSPSLPPQPSIAAIDKENAPSAAPTTSRMPAVEISMPAAGPLKTVLANGPKITSPVQKKLEGFELLEELRKKQEILAQKRDEFRRQLDKIEKQAISVKKMDTASEQVNKRHKSGINSEAAKAVTPRQTKHSMAGANQEAEQLQNTDSEVILVSPTSDASSTILQNSNLKHSNSLQSPVPNRFKLDNRPSFRILPPLPTSFADVAVLKDHFSSYGDLASVVLEDSEPRMENEMVKPEENFSACISFISRDSAERAYLNGRCWKGHTLHFIWQTTVTSKSKNSCQMQVIVDPPRSLSAEIKSETVAPGSSSSAAGSGICGVAAIRNGESSVVVEFPSCTTSTMPKDLSGASCSSPNVPSYEDSSSVSVALVVEDKLNVIPLQGHSS